jgi:hypothetical protein
MPAKFGRAGVLLLRNARSSFYFSVSQEALESLVAITRHLHLSIDPNQTPGLRPIFPPPTSVVICKTMGIVALLLFCPSASPPGWFIHQTFSLLVGVCALAALFVPSLIGSFTCSPQNN